MQFVLISLAGLSILTDLICSLLPIAIMWKIQMPLQKKISIWCLMAMGLVCTACSTVRAKSLNSKTQDIAYEYAIVAIWAVTEYVMLMCELFTRTVLTLCL